VWRRGSSRSFWTRRTSRVGERRSDVSLGVQKHELPGHDASNEGNLPGQDAKATAGRTTNVQWLDPASIATFEPGSHA
jgi:hypothetical protein